MIHNFYMKILLFTLLTSLVLVLGCSDKEATDNKSNYNEESAIYDVRTNLSEKLFEGCVLKNAKARKEKFVEMCSCIRDYYFDALTLEELEVLVDGRWLEEYNYFLTTHTEAEFLCEATLVPNEWIVRILKELNEAKLDGKPTQIYEDQLKTFEENGFDIDAHLKKYKDIFTAID